MPNIYLKHPVHGAKVAISPDEAALDKRNGWMEFDPTAPAQTETPSNQAVNELQPRRGRPRKVEPQGE